MTFNNDFMGEFRGLKVNIDYSDKYILDQNFKGSDIVSSSEHIFIPTKTFETRILDLIKSLKSNSKSEKYADTFTKVYNYLISNNHKEKTNIISYIWFYTK